MVIPKIRFVLAVMLAGIERKSCRTAKLQGRKGERNGTVNTRNVITRTVM